MSEERKILPGKCPGCAGGQRHWEVSESGHIDCVCPRCGWRGARDDLLPTELGGDVRPHALAPPRGEDLVGGRFRHYRGGDIRKRCREARALLRAAERSDEDPSDPTAPLWNTYGAHYDDDANPIVRKLVNSQWVPVESEEADGL